MSQNKTHRTRLARALAAESGISYQKALRAVTEQAERRNLPELNTKEGFERALALLGSLAKSAVEKNILLGTEGGGPVFLPSGAFKAHTLIFGQAGSGASVTAAKLVSGFEKSGWVGALVSYPNSTVSEARKGCTGSATVRVGGAGEASERVDFFTSVASGLLDTRALAGLLCPFEDAYWSGLGKRIIQEWPDAKEEGNQTENGIITYLENCEDEKNKNSADYCKLAGLMRDRAQRYLPSFSANLSSWQSIFTPGTLTNIRVEEAESQPRVPLAAAALLAGEGQQVRKGQRFLVLELGSLPADDSVVRLLASARSMGVAVVVFGSHETLLEKDVVRNTNVRIIHNVTEATLGSSAAKAAGLPIETALSNLAIGEGWVKIVLPDWSGKFITSEPE